MPLDYQAAITERARTPAAGLPTLVMLLGALLACVAAFIGGAAMRAVALVPFAVIGGILVLFLLSGMFIVNPNEAKVLLLFGKYAGSVRQPGM